MRPDQVETMPDSVPDIAVEVVRDRASLVRVLAQWEDLARHALEPNPLYEPEMMLPALDAAGESGFQCCLLWARDPERSDLPAQLGGLFPFKRERRYQGLPASTLRSWSHPSWVWELCTPLVRTDGTLHYIAVLLERLERDGTAVVEFRNVHRGGGFCDLLADALRDHESTLFAWDIATPESAGGPGLRNVAIGLGALGEMWVSMLPLLSRAKRRMAAVSRGYPPAVPV